MSTIECAEELNQPSHRRSNTGAMTATATEVAFVRCAVASPVLGLSPRLPAALLTATRRLPAPIVHGSRTRTSITAPGIKAVKSPRQQTNFTAS
jgi:hypothetical protein